MPGSARAQMFSDATLEALYSGERFAELERSSTARIAARADDAQAVLAFALLSMAEGSPLAAPAAAGTQRKNAIARAEACLEKNPAAAECHYALGVVLGIQAMSDGLLKAAGSAGRVRSALQEAQRLAPQWYPARSALMEFYLQAPGLLGGSRSKAGELAQAAPQPAQARALQARVLSSERTPAKLEAGLRQYLEHRSGSDAALDDDVRGWGSEAAFELLNKEAPAPAPTLAKGWFERLMAERPERALGAYGLGRCLAALGQHEAALAAYAKSAPLKGAEPLPVDYRIGLSLQALGRKAEARQALQRFVQAGKGNPRALEDARQRLEALGS